MDFRYTTSLHDAAVCNVPPQEPVLDGTSLLAPADAAHSVIALRMRALAVYRMPPLASAIVDDDGVALIESWIGGLSSCP
jgi:hypothetical protein